MTSALPDHVTSADATQSTSASAGGKVHLAQILQRTKDHMSIQHKVGWYYTPDNSRFTSLAILEDLKTLAILILKTSFLLV